MRDGGRYEDKPPSSIIPYLRSINHFHNPLTNEGLKGSWSSSIQWSQAPEGTQTPHGYYSWNDVRGYFYSALKAANKKERDDNFAATFRGLGQLMHLVQDMSVPSHTRDDVHIFYNYETWVSKQINLAKILTYDYIPFDPSAIGDANALAPVPVANIFDTEIYTGENPEDTLRSDIGLSEFTNANFLSADTIFKDFPHPDWSNLQEYEEEVPPGSGKWIVYNKKTGSGLDIEHFVREKIYYDKLPSQEAFRGLMLDDAVHKDYAQHLIPRAIGYSSQVLSYFFRGEIDLITNPQNSGGYVVENKTEEEMEGTFALYYDDTNDERQLLWDGDFTIGTRSSGNNKSGNIDLTEPNDAKKPGKYILVFQGRLGNETNAVTGKVVDMTPEFVVVQVADKCIVWHAKMNDYAKIRNTTDTGWVSFPCEMSDIQHWMAETVAALGNPCYTWSEAGEDAVPGSGDSGMSANTGCGSQMCTRIDNTSGCQSDDGMYLHCEVYSTYDLPATLQYASSYNLGILTTVGGSTCFRTAMHRVAGSYAHFEESVKGETWRQDYSTYTFYTPIGKLGSVDLGYYGKCYDCDSGGTCETDREVDDFVSSTTSIFSTMVMVQVYYCQFKVVESETNCFYGTWGGFCGYGPIQTTTTVLSENAMFVAACDYYKNRDTADKDPSVQNRNTQFEGAIQVLTDACDPNSIHSLSVSLRR